mmetsp:Transcript_6690/g.29473  ORF Transcript_6690/g.29473 Transcript_6690/m.29473 type:complete len:559 (+) Transcript_6690:42-1718(+)
MHLTLTLWAKSATEIVPVPVVPALADRGLAALDRLGPLHRILHHPRRLLHGGAPPGDDHDLRAIVHPQPCPRLALHALDVLTAAADYEAGVPARGYLDGGGVRELLGDLDLGLLDQIFDPPAAGLDDVGRAPQLDPLVLLVPFHHALGIRLRALDRHAAVAHDFADVVALDVNLERVRRALGGRRRQRRHVRGVEYGRDLRPSVANTRRSAANEEKGLVALARNLRAGVPFDALHLLTVLADDDPAILDRAFDALLDVIRVVAAAGRERSSAIVVAAAAAAAARRRAAIVVTVVPPASASTARGVAFVPAAVSVAEAAPVVPPVSPGLASNEAVLVVADDGAELVGGEIHGSPGAADHDGPVAALARAGLGLVDHDVGAGPVLQILDGVAAGADDDLGHLRGNFHLVLVPIVAAARGCSVARGVAARRRGVAGVVPAPAVVGGRRRAIVEAAAVAVSAAGGRRRASGIAGRRSRRGSAVGLVIPALAIVSAIVSARRAIVSAAGRAVAARALRLGAVPVAAVESVIGAAIAEAGVGPVAPAPRARRGRTARVGRRRVR